jgi:hypothetical protein
MTRSTFAQTCALPAIAAALALSSTSLSAQEAQPATADPPPATTAQPVPAVPDAAPPVTDVAPAIDTAPTVTQTTTTKTVKSAKRVAAAKAMPIATRSVSRSVTRTATPARVSTTATTSQTTADAAQASSRPKPVVDLNAKPSTPVVATAAARPTKHRNEALPIAGGALAFLAIGGAAVAMTRRRDDQEEWSEETIDEPAEAQAAPEPVQPALEDEQPAIVAPSAFAWSREPVDKPAVRGDGESHVERAYRGPTPENPSLSLRKRLKRAAFIDKREREAVAGTAAPVDATAGLPDRMLELQDRREFA